MLKYLSVLFICLFISTSSFAAEPSAVVFNNISVVDGLSQMSVTSIVQDDINRLWIGTRDGLNVYDGHRVKVYRSQRGDSTSLLGTEVVDLKVDEDRVWVATREGISCLDMRSQKFKRLAVVGVKSLLPVNDQLYFGTDRGLFQMDIETWLVSEVDNEISHSYMVNELYHDNAGFIWICTSEGLYKQSPGLDYQVRFCNGSASTVCVDSHNRVWVGTDDRGVFLYGKDGELIKHFSTNTHDALLSHDRVRAVCEDDKGFVWVGTFSGLNAIDSYTLETQIYKQNDGEGGLPNNSIYAIHNDKHSSLWVGSYFGGLSYINLSDKRFVHYKATKNSDKSISYPVIGALLEERDGDLWISTEGGGLNFYDKENRVFTSYVDTRELNSFNNVKCLYKPSEDILYFGAYLGGLSKMNLENGSIERFLHKDSDPLSISNNTVNAILPFGNDFLLATHNGVELFSPKDKVFTPFFTDKEHCDRIGKVVITIFEDSFGKVWIGTEKGGLHVYNVKTGELSSYFNDDMDYSSISSNTVVSIYEDHQMRLWLGTAGGGLCQYNRTEDNFTNYNALNNALSGDFICDIKESRYGNLWVSTTKGLTWFDVEKQTGVSMLSNEGFPLSELNYNSLLITREGQLYVGGIDGLLSFDEASLFNQFYDVNISFSSLEVNNKEVVPHDETGVLLEGINYTHALKLYPKHKSFSLYFSDCAYSDYYRLKLRYRLSDHDEWLDTDKSQRVSFVNLSPGKYNFTLQSISTIDGEVFAERNLLIHILPPIYRRWYAYFAYLLFILILIWQRNKVYLERVRLKDNLESEKREKKQMQDMNQAKLRFFTNISHEFRTPLTLIVGTADLILSNSRKGAKNYNHVKTIESNAKRLNYLISELLDFRRLEQGHLALHVEKTQLQAFLKSIGDSFSAYALARQVDFEIKEISPLHHLWFDFMQMEKVMYNLLSNAFKAVPAEGGWVTVDLVEQTDSIELSVSNNGATLDDDQVNYIFDRFYQIDHLGDGNSSGIGLAFTKTILEEHHGAIRVNNSQTQTTTFTITLLKGNKHFTPEQLQVVARAEGALDGALQLPAEAHEVVVNSPKDMAVKVLVVDDNAELRTLVNTVLAPNYSIIEAEDGQEGLEVAIEEQPDLIISDVMMPRLSGTELCRKLRNNESTSHIPIVLLTAQTAMEQRIVGTESGADEYLTKPFNMRLLKAVVKNLIARKEKLQEGYKVNPDMAEKDLAVNSMDTELLEKACNIVGNNLANDTFDVAAFAKEMGLGRTRLFSKIKGVTGQTPNEFILSVRMKRAAHLFKHNPSLNISEVTFMVGFNTPRYFTLCFKEHYGLTPSAYIKQMRQKE